MLAEKRIWRAGAIALFGLILWGSGAHAQMFEDPYSNRNVDRAGMAIFMKQLDMGLFNRNSSSVSGSGSGGEILLCGGPDSNSAATANSSCIIIGDGATGVIDLGQQSDGDQTADTNVNQTQNNNSSQGELSDVLEGLNDG